MRAIIDSIAIAYQAIANQIPVAGRKMTTDIVSINRANSNSPFDEIRHVDESGNEYWLARELQKLAGYSKWQNFEKVILKTLKSLKNSGDKVFEHVTEVSKSFISGNGAVKSTTDYKLSRKACYLVFQNGDPEKSQIALAQSYFAIKTRESEIAQTKYPQLPTTYLEALEALVASEKAKQLAESRISVLEEKVDELAQYASIIRAARHNDVHEATFSWRALKSVSIENGWAIKRVQCPRFGSKNLYDVRAFSICYPKYNFDFDLSEDS